MHKKFAKNRIKERRSLALSSRRLTVQSQFFLNLTWIMKLILTLVCLSFAVSGGNTGDPSVFAPTCVNNNYLVLHRQHRQRGKYLGCFQDSINSRMFLGSFTQDPQLTIEKCIEFCSSRRYVYAGYHGP